MALIDDLYALIVSPVRAIGTIIPNVVVEEVHRDTLAITDHPVERGAAISDHAFLLPKRVEMRCGWSDSTAGFGGYVDLVYQELLSLQSSRQPFTVFTGKRFYTNMLIESLEVTTDEKSEYSLIVIAGLREIIITNTTTTSYPSTAQQATPQKTGQIANTGTKQLSPVRNITGPIAAAGG